MRLLSGHNIHPLRMAGHTGNNIPAGASMLFHGFFQSRKDSIASRLSKNQIDEKCHSIFYEQANLFRSFKCRTRSLWAVSLCGRCICSNRTESQHDFLLFQMWTSFFFISMPFFFFPPTHFAIACSMSDVDKKLFPSDSRNFVWTKFLFAYYAGMRVYVLLDPLETFPKSKIKLRKLKYIHYTLKYSLIGVVMVLVYAFIVKRILDLVFWCGRRNRNRRFYINGI